MIIILVGHLIQMRKNLSRNVDTKIAMMGFGLMKKNVTAIMILDGCTNCLIDE